MVVRQKLTGHYVGPPDAVKALVAQSVKAAITSPPRAKAARRSGAFVAEHQRCGDLDSGTDNGYVWMQCSCGGLIMQPAGERPRHPASSRPA